MQEEEKEEMETKTTTTTTTEFFPIEGEVTMYPEEIYSLSRGGVGGNNTRNGGRRWYDTHGSKVGEEGEIGGVRVDPTSILETTMTASVD